MSKQPREEARESARQIVDHYAIRSPPLFGLEIQSLARAKQVLYSDGKQHPCECGAQVSEFTSHCGACSRKNPLYTY